MVMLNNQRVMENMDWISPFIDGIDWNCSPPFIDGNVFSPQFIDDFPIEGST